MDSDSQPPPLFWLLWFCCNRVARLTCRQSHTGTNSFVPFWGNFFLVFFFSSSSSRLLLPDNCTDMEFAFALFRSLPRQVSPALKWTVRRRMQSYGWVRFRRVVQCDRCNTPLPWPPLSYATATRGQPHPPRHAFVRTHVWPAPYQSAPRAIALWYFADDAVMCDVRWERQTANGKRQTANGKR